jgi:hypothetical protein
MVAREPQDPATGEDLDAHPGRPRRPDEIDPELQRLPRARTRIGWLLALSVIALCSYVMFQLRSDLAFSRQGDRPEPLPSLESVFDADLDSFVSIEGIPDRAYAVRALKSDSSLGQRLYPLFGTDGRVWLLVSGSSWTEDATYDERWVGRVKRLQDMPFFGSLRRYLAESRPLPRYTSPAIVRAALEGRATEILHATGDRIAVDASTPVTIARRAADRARVTATATEDHPDEARWRAALERAGIVPAGAQPESGNELAWRYLVPALGGVAALQKRLDEAGLGAARAEEVVETRDVAWGELGASDEGLRADDDLIPWQEIAQLSVAERRTVPDDARVLVASERPRDYWYLLPLFGVLSVFALVFVWAFARSVQADRGAAEAPTAA